MIAKVLPSSAVGDLKAPHLPQDLSSTQQSAQGIRPLGSTVTLLGRLCFGGKGKALCDPLQRVLGQLLAPTASVCGGLTGPSQ